MTHLWSFLGHFGQFLFVLRKKRLKIGQKKGQTLLNIHYFDHNAAKMKNNNFHQHSKCCTNFYCLGIEQNFLFRQCCRLKAPVAPFPPVGNKAVHQSPRRNVFRCCLGYRRFFSSVLSSGSLPCSHVYIYFFGVSTPQCCCVTDNEK